MNKDAPLIKKPEDFLDPRARSILQKYEINVLEISYLFSQYEERGLGEITLNDVKRDPTIIKQFAVVAALNYEMTKRETLRIPVETIPFQISVSYGDKTDRCKMELTDQFFRDRLIEENEKRAEFHLKIAESMEDSLKDLITIKKTASKIMNLMGLENAMFDVEINPDLTSDGALTYAFLSDGRLASILYLRELNDPINIIGLLAHEFGHPKFNKKHPVIERFLHYLNLPLEKVRAKYKKFPKRLSKFYLPYQLNEYLATREAREGGIPIDYFTHKLGYSIRKFFHQK
jgi:hypothetical protein